MRRVTTVSGPSSGRGSKIPQSIWSDLAALGTTALIAASPIGHWPAIAYGLAHGLPAPLVIVVVGLAGYLPVELCRFVRNPGPNTSGKRAEQLVRRYGPYLGVLTVMVLFGSYITLATMAVAGLGGDRRAHLSALVGSMLLALLGYGATHTTLRALQPWLMGQEWGEEMLRRFGIR